MKAVTILKKSGSLQVRVAKETEVLRCMTSTTQFLYH